VRYNLELGLRLRGVKVSEDVIERYVARYGLEGLEGKPVSKLSAGRAKLVSIMRSLLLRPRLLALDEPFTFLDSTRASLLVEDLVEVVRSGGIVVATHYMHRELRDCSEQVIELMDGEATLY